MKESLKLAFALTIYSVVACTALAIVNSYTAPVIEAKKQQEIQKALKNIFPDADQFTDVIDGFVSTNKLVSLENAYVVKQGENILGMTVTAKGPTYKKCTVMVGVELSGNIKTIRFIELNDTKGIGTRVGEPEFMDQFKGKSTTDNFIVGKDIDGLSGATISSKGVSRIVNVSAKVANDYLRKNISKEGVSNGK